MSGNVAHAADREAIFAAAHRKFGAVEISGDIVFASGAPPGFVEAVSVALQVLARLAGGHVEIADKTITVDGLVYQSGAIEDISDALAEGLPEGFSVASNTVTTGQDDQMVDAAQCRDLLQVVLKTGRIAFDGTKADIAGDSVGVLDRVSAAIARCPEVAIEVGAHSNSEGSSSRNRDRTQSRAEAIVDFLVSAGIKRERLAAVGYGETKPVADNNTDQGKATNRRIEFSVELPSGG